MLFFDAHCDTLSKNVDLAENDGHFDFTRAAARGPGFQVMAAFGEDQLEQLRRFASWNPPENSPGFRLLPAVEGGDCIRTLYDLDDYLAYDLAFFGLTWNHDNHLAGGCLGSGGGLTPLGQEVVRALERAGVTVDLAHASEQTFWDVLEMASKPVAVTHACCHALCPHPRNLKKPQMKALSDAGGVLGITFYPPFLKKDWRQNACGLDDVRRHIETAVSVMGPTAVGLGSDFDGCECLPRGIRDIGDVPALLETLPASIRKGVAGENWVNLLKQQGYL